MSDQCCCHRHDSVAGPFQKAVSLLLTAAFLSLFLTAFVGAVSWWENWRDTVAQQSQAHEAHRQLVAPRSYQEFATTHSVGPDHNSNSAYNISSPPPSLSEALGSAQIAPADPWHFGAAHGAALVRSATGVWYLDTSVWNQAFWGTSHATPYTCQHDGVCVTVWHTADGWFAEVYSQRLLPPMPATVKGLPGGLEQLPADHIRIIDSWEQSAAYQAERSWENTVKASNAIS